MDRELHLAVVQLPIHICALATNLLHRQAGHIAVNVGRFGRMRGCEKYSAKCCHESSWFSVTTWSWGSSAYQPDAQARVNVLKSPRLRVGLILLFAPDFKL